MAQFLESLSPEESEGVVLEAIRGSNGFSEHRPGEDWDSSRAKEHFVSQHVLAILGAEGVERVEELLEDKAALPERRPVATDAANVACSATKTVSSPPTRLSREAKLVRAALRKHSGRRRVLDSFRELERVHGFTTAEWSKGRRELSRWESREDSSISLEVNCQLQRLAPADAELGWSAESGGSMVSATGEDAEPPRARHG